jgi:hypothetical protein
MPDTIQEQLQRAAEFCEHVATHDASEGDIQRIALHVATIARVLIGHDRALRNIGSHEALI